MPDYQKGKIYKLVSDHTDEIYIGSTIQKLCTRLGQHARDFRESKNKYTSKKLFELGKVKIILIENCPCDSKEELYKRERHYIETMVCVNKYIPGRTKAEYLQDNKEEISKKRKEYRLKNNDKIKESYKEYYLKNIDKINEIHKEYRIKNKDKIKEHYLKNKDKINEQMKEYHLKNKDKLKERKKEYSIKNKDKIKEYKKEYYLKNKDKIKESKKLKKSKTEVPTPSTQY